MSFDFGDVVIVPFPFVLKSGESEQKARPAVVVSNQDVDRRYDDVLLSAKTSNVPDESFLLEIKLPQTEQNGLAKDSLLRLDFIMTVPDDIVSRKIGELASDKRETVSNKLASYFDVIGSFGIWP